MYRLVPIPQAWSRLLAQTSDVVRILRAALKLCNFADELVAGTNLFTDFSEELLQMEQLAVRHVLEAFFRIQPVEPEVLASDLLHGSYQLFFRLLRIISEARFYNRERGVANEVHHAPKRQVFWAGERPD